MSDNDGSSAGPPKISFTRKRTTTKTRTAASSARRRKNIPLVHASGGGDGTQGDGKDQHSWFARKSAGWTDEEIKSHLVSGGASQGGASFSMVGDVILGDGPSGKKKNKKMKRRVGGPMFAWEEEEQDENEEDEEGGYNKMNISNRGVMRAAPTLSDIMDQKDQIDFMTNLKVGKQYQMKDAGDARGEEGNGQSNESKTKSSKLRSQNAALAELAAVSGVDHGAKPQPTSANESVGWRLLRVWGYRSRLGMAFVPLSGYVGGNAGIDSQVKDLEKEVADAATHEAKWLASRHLRAIRLPSIQNVESNNVTSTDTADKGKSKTILTIPPPKLNRHGIGYDPFQNAPEFRAFHEKRRALAQKQGRGTDDNSQSNNGGKRGDRYFTDNLRKDGRQALWDSKKAHNGGEDSDDDLSDPGPVNSQGKMAQHAHYAADRDYSDFIGARASSGFMLQDEDDANVYQDDDDDGHAFPANLRGDNCGVESSQYTNEIQSPVASDDEEGGINGGLFGKSAAAFGGKTKMPTKRTNEAEDKGKMADAWNAWGMGTEDSGIASANTKTTTMDGKPPLPGFKVSQIKLIVKEHSQGKLDGPKFWKGPLVPSGYVLKRHIFKVVDKETSEASSRDRVESGFGLDLQRRQQRQQPPRSFVPKVLPPPSSGELKSQGASKKMLAKDGTELNFHAVKASMKSRFVTSVETTDAQKSGNTDKEGQEDQKQQNLDKEEWVQVSATPWLPTRLLCKRWGVPVPSTVGMTAEGGAAGTTVGKLQNKEAEFFRHTIYEPAVASQHEKNKDASGGNVVEGDLPPKPGQALEQPAVDNPFIGEDSMAPPPTRPSDDVFRSIFDVESDMDISSSEDEKEEKESGQCQIASTTSPANTITEEETRQLNMKAPKINDEIHKTTSTQPSRLLAAHDSDSDSDSSSSASSRDRRKRRRYNDHKKRKKKEKQRRRRRDSDSESDGSDNHRRKKRKHKQKSRSRHEKLKHKN